MWVIGGGHQAILVGSYLKPPRYYDKTEDFLLVISSISLTCFKLNFTQIFYTNSLYSESNMWSK